MVALDCGSQSRNRIRLPRFARATAVLTAQVDLPTPPFSLSHPIERTGNPSMDLSGDRPAVPGHLSAAIPRRRGSTVPHDHGAPALGHGDAGAPWPRGGLML